MAKVKNRYDGDVCEYLGIQGVGKTNLDSVDLYMNVYVSCYDDNGNLCDSINLEFRDIQELKAEFLRASTDHDPESFELDGVTFFLGEGSKRKRRVSHLYYWARRYGKDRKMPVCEIRNGYTAPDDDRIWLRMQYDDNDDYVFFDNMDVLLCKDFYDKIGVANFVVSLWLVQNGREFLQIW